MRLQELLEQIAVGAMDFDAIESGSQRVAGGLPKAFDHTGDLTSLERARRLIRHNLSVRRHCLQRRRNRHRRWRDRQHAAGLERGVRDASDVPELQEDHPAPGVNRIDDVAPALDLPV